MTVQTSAPVELGPGLHAGVPMKTYLALPAIGSTSLSWLAESPLRFKYNSEHPPKSTEALDLGTALHVAVLLPDLFEAEYCEEPDVEKMAGSKPRATKEYRQRVEDMEQGGYTVLRADVMKKVRAMAAAVFAHPQAVKVLERCPERELTMLWKRGNRLLRGRCDMLGRGVLGDLKSTRSLRDFSPWSITKYGYYRQAALYEDGLTHHDREMDLFFHVAVESVAPYDVGVFALEADAIELGRRECTELLQLHAECIETGRWPGRYPTVAPGMITDAAIANLAGVEAA